MIDAKKSKRYANMIQEFDAQQLAEFYQVLAKDGNLETFFESVVKHGTHDQSSHAGARARTGGEVKPSGSGKPRQATGEEVTDPNAPKPKLKPGRKPDATGTLDERAEKLAKGERIQVSKKEVKQMIDILAKRSDNPDLTNMHIEDTKLYDEDNLGIPRNKMPQVPSDTKGQFITVMEKRGARAQRGVADPTKLHPIQAEISASKSAQISKALKEKGTATDDGGRIIISRDNYIIDGHHRWAAAAMLSMEDPSIRLPVIKVDMDHKDLIDATLAWNQATGIQSIGMGESNRAGQLRKWAEFDAIVAKAVKGRTIIKFQPGLKPAIKHLAGQHDQSTHGSWAGYSSANATAMWGEKRAKDLQNSENIGPTKDEILMWLNEGDVDSTIAIDLFNEVYGRTSKTFTSEDGELKYISANVTGVSNNYDAFDNPIIKVEGDIVNEIGEPIGTFARNFGVDESDNFFVEHEFFKIRDESYRGSGFGTDFVIDSENYYITHEVDFVKVHAGLETGGYTWAKMGFQWDKNGDVEDLSKTRISRAITNFVEDAYRLDSDTKKTLSLYAERLNNVNMNDDPEPWEIATLVSERGVEVGKNIMLGTDWFGVKYMTPSGRANNVAQTALENEGIITTWRKENKTRYDLSTGEVSGQKKLFEAGA